MSPETFHFLRPAWLFLLVPAAILLGSALRRSTSGSPWRRLVDEHLLRHLLVPGEAGTSRWPLWALGAAWMAACLALAGPAWERLPQPLYTSLDPTVVALDLSSSMEKSDLSPSRRMRARYELQDLLEEVRGGQVALVVFTDEPFVAVPLTDDERVVAELIPSLTAELMPSEGSRADRAIDQAAALLEQADAGHGRILLLTDGVDDPELAAAAATRAEALGHVVSVLGLAPEEALDRPALESIATAGGGTYATASAQDTDLAQILGSPVLDTAGAREQTLAHADEWRDAGVWLLLVPVLLAPLAFRRGWLAALALSLAVAPSGRADASTWDDLWQRRDQQGATALAEGRHDEAIDLFENPAWRSAAQYQAGRYADATAGYRAQTGAESRYNLGNSLARSGDLKGALAAYDEALKELPQHEDARFNRDLVDELLRQQEQQEQHQPQQAGSQEQSQDQAQNGSSQDPSGDGRGEQQTGAESPAAEGERSQGADASSSGSQSESQDPAGEQGRGEAPTAGDPQAGTGTDAAQTGSESPPSEQAKAPGSGQDHDRDEAGSSSEQKHATASAGERPPQDPAVAGSDRAHAAAQDPKDEENSLTKQLSEMLGGDEPEDAGERGERVASATAHSPKPLSEEEQAREQRLRQVPDDPGGLLRAKIHRRYAERRFAQEGQQPW
jgi:Ca-activated chloride channel family protein